MFVFAVPGLLAVAADAGLLPGVEGLTEDDSLQGFCLLSVEAGLLPGVEGLAEDGCDFLKEACCCNRTWLLRDDAAYNMTNGYSDVFVDECVTAATAAAFALEKF